MEQLSNGLTAARIDALAQVAGAAAHPFSSADRLAGLLYQVSILQAEFSLTQVLDRPLHGRAFFEDVIRENLDLGASRPSAVDLRPARQQAHAVALSHPSDYPRRGAVAARRLL